MKFQIKTLIVWPKSRLFPPRVVEFELGKLNIITGASRTGKSAIIPIIDYCLASSDCFIPIDTIRDFSSWYGVIFQTDDEQILIARKVPDGNKASNDFFIIRGEIISIPPSIENSNEKIDGIKNILNSISFVPSVGLQNEDERRGFKARLGFRDLMALVFQTQEIVANQNILFYKTHAHEHRERLRNWFPFILGAENMDVLLARQRLQEVERRLAQLKREYDRVKSVSESWVANMEGHLRIAKEYGLLDNVLITEESTEELLAAAKHIVNNIPDHSLTKIDNISVANKEIEVLESNEEKLSSNIGVVKKRLNDLHRLKSGLIDYGGSVAKRVERLHISQWLQNVGAESEVCPTCGSTEHPNSRQELEKISSIYKQLEIESKKIAEVPTSFAREEEKLNSELRSLLDEKSALQKRYDLLILNDRKAQEEFQQRKSMYLFLGHLKSSIETFERLIDGGDLQKEIDTLEKEFEELMGMVDPEGIKRKIQIATAQISQRMLNHLATLDVDDKYRKMPPVFSVEDLNISVLSDDNHWHFLAEVGSASNWVSFHIALMCSLQEHFIIQKNSSVPSFVILDQPSQVYFPKLKRITNEPNPVLYESDEDVEAVKNMFTTVSKSILNNNGLWQAIILDHADSSIYGGIDGVYEVDVWRNGKKLIPEEWYSGL